MHSFDIICILPSTHPTLNFRDLLHEGWTCYHIVWEESVGCFTLIVFLPSSCCYCFLPLTVWDEPAIISFWKRALDALLLLSSCRHVAAIVFCLSRCGVVQCTIVAIFGYTITIYQECEGRIEKSVPRIAFWHHEACRVLTNGGPEGRIFLSYPHTNNGFFFLLTTAFIYLFIYLFISNKLPEVPEYAKMRFHMMTLLDVLGKIAWVR